MEQSEISKPKNRAFPIAIIVAILIALFSIAIFLLFYSGPYKYGLEQEGIEFFSNSAEPAQMLKSLGSRNSFIISPEFEEKGSALPFMTSALTTFTGILVANKKEAITLLRIIDASGELRYCSTNDGNRNIARNITSGECDSMLSGNRSVKILIESANPLLPKPRVILDEDKITIEPKGLSGMQRLSLLVLKAMYANSEDIIRQINERLGGA
ncbi:MAG: hypothetical protein HYW05_02460 [Candidatus Diapherotrites archaeon]|nr:hypothetical protein [Candidatus Diapherotrites archaeon]